jgi:carbon monoxide dehydrogenase subunit G
LKISGTSSVPASQERAYALLQDPTVLARCMPGCEGLDPIGEGEYAMRLKMSIASMSGLFQGKVRVTDQNPHTSFRLIVEGNGKIGFMKGDGVLTLTANSPDTVVHFEGEVQVGGTMASVGQRLMETTAKMLIKKFFERLTTEASAAART